MEDVIDVSTENLARLKEEAQMAENDTIMRYIRVLSELSGQIRYASQKRILVEMTLIKLCRPGMETDVQSLTDRIRQLEEKLESGVFVAASHEGAVSGSRGSGLGTEAPKEAAALPHALPQDVEKVVGRWQAIIAQSPMPMKAYLKASYPSLAADGSLLVVAEDGLPSDYLKEEHHRQELEQILAEFVGKEIKIMVQSTQQGRNPRELYPDLTKLVSQTIHMEVEELEEEPEAFDL